MPYYTLRNEEEIMTNKDRVQITNLQQQGFGYKRISSITGISVNTVKSFCRAHPVSNESESRCLFCGSVLRQTPHKRQKKYCSDKCRNAWWVAHPELRKANAAYSHLCLGCGKRFFTDRKESKYCSVSCFAAARRKEN